ncbi:MAG: tetratricopeptide repeat protein [Capsulimonadaceae bacterium]
MLTLRVGLMAILASIPLSAIAAPPPANHLTPPVAAAPDLSIDPADASHEAIAQDFPDSYALQAPDAVGEAQADGIVFRVINSVGRTADWYFDHGDYPRAIAVDRIVVSAWPSSVDTYTSAAWLTDSLGYHAMAEGMYQQCVELNPRSAYAYYNLGVFYFNTMKDYTSATTVFLADTRQCPDADANDWKMLAHSYEKRHMLPEAVATWRATASRWPDGPAVQTNLKRVLAELAAASTTTSVAPAQ